MQFYRQESNKVGYFPAKYGSHGHSDSGDIVISVCHLISKDHVIKGSFDFMVRSLST